VDPGHAIVAIAGMITGLLTTGAIVWGVVQFARARHQGRLPDSELREEVAALHEQVAQLQQQVYETQERLDFTERLLTKGRDAHEAR
jgi:uncharacterized protein YlxW (UPF0749 family)